MFPGEQLGKASVQIPAIFDADEPSIWMMATDSWQPLSATQTKISNWSLEKKEASSAEKQRAAPTKTRTFSATGTIHQDDADACRTIARGFSWQLIRRQGIYSQMRLALRNKLFTNFPGSVKTRLSIYGEVTEFDVLLEWQKYMSA
ncbi:MAG: hypothetical protein VW985_12055 [Gammaproteobacteria bacterium]